VGAGASSLGVIPNWNVPDRSFELRAFGRRNSVQSSCPFAEVVEIATMASQVGPRARAERDLEVVG
jgi:hypothetical protein